MIILEMDSTSAIALLTSNSVIFHPYGPVIQRVCDFLKRSWIVERRHAFREPNRSVDTLATFGYLHQLGVAFYELPLISLGSFLHEDLAGVAIPRFLV